MLKKMIVTSAEGDRTNGFHEAKCESKGLNSSHLCHDLICNNVDFVVE